MIKDKKSKNATADPMLFCEDGKACISLRGEIDHHRAALLRGQLDDEICRFRPHELRLDLSGIDFMDSSGLGLILGRSRLLAQLGGELIVSRPSPAVRRMLDLSGMERIVRIE